MTETLQPISCKLPVSDLRRIPSRNVSRFVREAVHEKLERQAANEWKPKTDAGKKMVALRARYLAQGGELLDAEGIAAEILERRGGLA